MIKKLLLPICLILCFGCVDGDEPFFSRRRPPADAAIYVPVYSNAEDILQLNKVPAKQIERPSKIFTYNNFLIVNIKNEGFHVIDNSNPSRPQNLFFIEIPGNNDVAIKDGVIYADNYSDIVTFTIEENGELQLVERLENIISTNDFPPFNDVYFECPDPSKGFIVDWVLGNVEDPKCYR